MDGLCLVVNDTDSLASSQQNIMYATSSQHNMMYVKTQRNLQSFKAKVKVK